MHHAAANGGDDAHIVMNGDAVGLGELNDALDDLFAHGLQVRSNNDHAHGIDTGGHMFEGNAVFFNGLQHAATEAVFHVHHGLFNRDNAETQLAGYAGDNIGIFLIRQGVRNKGTRILGLVGVADVGGDTRTVYGEHAVLVQYACAHVAQLSQFTVGDVADGLCAGHDAGVSHKETAHICPVFVHLSLCGTGDDGAADIAAATAESMNFFFKAAVEAGDNGLLGVLEQRGQGVVGTFTVERAILIEEDKVLGVKEGVIQIVRQKQTVEVFAAAGAIVAACTVGNILRHFIQINVDIDLKLQFFGDLTVAFADTGKGSGKILPVLLLAVSLVQQVGYFVITVKTAAGSAGHHIAAALIHIQDGLYLLKLFCIGQRAAAELGNNLTHSISFLPGCAPSNNAQGTILCQSTYESQSLSKIRKPSRNKLFRDGSDYAVSPGKVRRQQGC